MWWLLENSGLFYFKGGADGPSEESQSSAVSTETTGSVKKKGGRMEVGDGEK